jgi:hypothetical protein
MLQRENSDASSNFCDVSKLWVKSRSTKAKENNSRQNLWYGKDKHFSSVSGKTLLKIAGVTPVEEY